MSDISLIGLGVGLLLMIIPLFYFHRYRTGLVHSTMSAVIRMIAQLYLVGLYLQYLFEYNIWYVNLAWGLIMVAVATGTALQRTHLRPHVVVMPLGVALLVTAFVISLYFLGLVLGLDHAAGHAQAFHAERFTELFTARYFIPIFGLLLGNMLGVNIIALNTYYDGLKREQQLYFYLLGNGATHREATAPLIRQAMIKAFNPAIANMAVMGLVAMPGTMIGQILGGSDPSLAIKYQMMIAVITFVASLLSLVITISLSRSRSFDAFGRLKEIYK